MTISFHIIGDAFVDLFSFLDNDWPEKGGDSTLNQPIQTYAGGSSTNTTTHLNALLEYFERQENTSQETNMQLTLHTILNPTDQFGKVLLNHAQEHNFELVNCKQEDDASATGHCVAIVAGQERSFMTYRGCVDRFDARHLDIDRMIRDKGHIHLHIAGFYNLSNFQNGKITQQIQHIRKQRLEQLPTRQTIVSMVPQHDATKQWDGGIDALIPCLDFLIMNDLEAMHIMQQGKMRRLQRQQQQESSHTNGTTTNGTNGDPPPGLSLSNSTTDHEQLLQDCLVYFGEISPQTCVVLTQGPLGAVALQNGAVVARQSTVSVKPIDPTGAGDSFSAGFLYGLWAWRKQQQETQHQQQQEAQFLWPAKALEEALLWGCSIGTSSVLIRGASIPSSKEDIQQFYSNIKESNGHTQQ